MLNKYFSSIQHQVQEEVPEDNMEEMMGEDDYSYSNIMDPNLHLELENLKLEQLKVKEEQLAVKQRVILLKQADRRPVLGSGSLSRSILPDGKILVRNTNDRADADVPFSAGAGDSLTLPGLQRVGVKLCVACGTPADSYCAGCGLTPYCSIGCQRRDWVERHKSVCHNLARTCQDKEVNEVPAVESRLQAPAPLRRPHFANDQRKDAQRDDDAVSHVSKASVRAVYNNKNNQKLQPRRDDYQEKRGNNNYQDNRDDVPEKKNNYQQKRDNGYQKNGPQDRSGQQRVRGINEHSPKATPVQPEIVAKSQIEIPTAVPAKPVAEPAPVTKAPAYKPASLAEVTPQRKALVPKSYLVNELSVGDGFLLSVDAKTSDCRESRGDYVCLTMHDRYESDYQRLCEDYVLACDADHEPYQLVPGAACSYFNVQDGGWYRGRCLNASTVALLDGGRLVAVQPSDKVKRLAPPYDSLPEFCAVLHCSNVEIGLNLMCTIKSKTSDSCVVTLDNVETGTSVGEGEITRWLPTVDYAAAVTIPEVKRPSLTNSSRVLLVDAASLDKMYVRPTDAKSQERYDNVLQQVLLSGLSSQPLTEPPLKGQTVIGKFTDGIHYRALCKRTNAAKNKYLLEYIEFGNVEVQKLEDIYPCPQSLDLDTVPTEVSLIKIDAVHTDLTPPATELIDKVKDAVELIVTVPGSADTIPSGSVASLAVAHNMKDLSSKLASLCTPDWQRMLDDNQDILDVTHFMYAELQFRDLPPEGCSLTITDTSMLGDGTLCGYNRQTVDTHLYTALEKQMEVYCNSPIGKEPYLPRIEEVCIAKLPNQNLWRRAVVIERPGGPGSNIALLFYFDYGQTVEVLVADIRKMLPEFFKLPPMTVHIDVRNFPQPATTGHIARAKKFMKIDDKGFGTLNVTKCVKADALYVCDAPELIEFIS